MTHGQIHARKVRRHRMNPSTDRCMPNSMRPEDALGLMSDIRKRSDEQARQRLVEIALATAESWAAWRPSAGATRSSLTDFERRCERRFVSLTAGFSDPDKGSWCAAGLTAAMEDAGLLVPASGTPARREAVALLDFVANRAAPRTSHRGDSQETVLAMLRAMPAQPGDIVAWLQHPPPQERTGEHAFVTLASAHSLCGMHRINVGLGSSTKRCSSCVWMTRKGHVAVIVEVDEESVTTVGWNEGAAPGRVMKRRLWRDPEHRCETCGGVACWTDARDGRVKPCPTCKGRGRVLHSATVLGRRPGGLYGIARPVAR